MTYQKCIDHSKMHRFVDCYGYAICIHYLQESEDNVELYWAQNTYPSIVLPLSLANIPWWTVSLTSIHNLKGIQINLCVIWHRKGSASCNFHHWQYHITVLYVNQLWIIVCVLMTMTSNTRNYYIKLLYIFHFLAVQI